MNVLDTVARYRRAVAVSYTGCSTEAVSFRLHQGYSLMRVPQLIMMRALSNTRNRFEEYLRHSDRAKCWNFTGI